MLCTWLRRPFLLEDIKTQQRVFMKDIHNDFTFEDNKLHLQVHKQKTMVTTAISVLLYCLFCNIHIPTTARATGRGLRSLGILDSFEADTANYIKNYRRAIRDKKNCFSGYRLLTEDECSIPCCGVLT